MRRIYWLVMVVLLLPGCASLHVPDYAFSDPAKTISRPHPREIEKSGVTHLTRLGVIHSEQLWVESTAAAGNGSVDFADFFPALAVDAESGAIVARGRTEFVSSVLKLLSPDRRVEIMYDLPILPNGVLTSSLELDRPRSQLEHAMLFYMSHDGQHLFNSAGQEVLEEVETVKDGRKVVERRPFNPEKFESEEQYRLRFKPQALTLAAHEESWRQYLTSLGIEPKPTMVITVGQGELWAAFKTYLYQTFPETYETSNGDWRIGKVDFGTWCRIAHNEPGFGPVKRTLRDLVVPASSLLAFTGVGAAVAGAQFVGQVTSSSINLNIEGLYGTAMTQRQGMSQSFTALQSLTRIKHEQQLTQVRQLERENADLRQKLEQAAAKMAATETLKPTMAPLPTVETPKKPIKLARKKN